MFRFSVQAVPGTSIVLGGTDFDGDLSVWFLKRSEKISGDRKLVIGLCFQAVGALVIAVSEGILPMARRSGCGGFRRFRRG